MIREAEVKTAFRVAYDALDECSEPSYTEEYLSGVLRRFEEKWSEHKDNGLPRYLCVGICQWLGDVAKESRGNE